MCRFIQKIWITNLRVWILISKLSKLLRRYLEIYSLTRRSRSTVCGNGKCTTSSTLSAAAQSSCSGSFEAKITITLLDWVPVLNRKAFRAERKCSEMFDEPWVSLSLALFLRNASASSINNSVPFLDASAQSNTLCRAVTALAPSGVISPPLNIF